MSCDLSTSSWVAAGGKGEGEGLEEGPDNLSLTLSMRHTLLPVEHQH